MLAWLRDLPARLGSKLTVGGLYAVPSEEGGYLIAKILALDSAVHVAVFRNRFAELPSRLDPASLDFGTIHDGGFTGVGHLPYRYGAFLRQAPRFIQAESVSEDELDGYRDYPEMGGQPWG